MDNTPAGTVGRNAPCPCGSGKRYKECHGALETPAAAPEAGPAAWIPQALRAALTAQREGRVSDAAQRYREVLAVDPSNFDATHMLSLVEYEIGHYDEAVSLIRRAIELRPELNTPRQNLRLLQALPVMEVEICREALPRLRARVDTRFDLARLGDGRSVHVVSAFGEAEREVLHMIASVCGSRLKLWREHGAGVQAEAEPLTAERHPVGGWLVLLGATLSVSGWLASARADGALVVATRDQPCAIIDRLDELAAEGYARPGLLCATPALAQRLDLPPMAAVSAMTAPVRSR
jgi:tetratricopeptide (TPR) repeat protein